MPRRGRRRVLGAAVVLALALLLPLARYLWLYLDNPRRPPALSRATIGAVAKMARAVPAYYRDLVSAAPEIEKLGLGIEDRHLRKIARKRAEAMRVGVLFASPDDRVPATLAAGGEVVDVRVRLKGDLADHWARGRRSLRVEVSGGASVLGLRRFSLHPPWARGFHREPLFFDLLRDAGLIAPRTRIVELAISGRRAGLMELEEHASGELLEAHARPPGVIFKFDEEPLWRGWVEAAERRGVRWSLEVPKPAESDDWRAARIEAFGAGAIRRSERLAADLERVEGLLRAVAASGLAPSRTFDAERWGRFLAYCEVFGAPHMALWNNLRFYSNPETGLVEPVAFDTDVLPERWRWTPGGDRFVCSGQDRAFTTALVADPAVRAELGRALATLDRQLRSEAYEPALRAREDRYLRPLRREFPWLEPFDLESARRRSAALRARAWPRS